MQRGRRHCAPRLVAAFDRVVRGAQRWRAREAQPRYEVFIEHRLGTAMDELLQGTDPYVTPGDVVNYFLRDRSFMAKLMNGLTVLRGLLEAETGRP